MDDKSGLIIIIPVVLCNMLAQHPHSHTGRLQTSESQIEKNWVVFSEIPLAGSHENHLNVYVSEMENPSLISSCPSLSSLLQAAVPSLPPSPVTARGEAWRW